MASKSWLDQQREQIAAIAASMPSSGDKSIYDLANSVIKSNDVGPDGYGPDGNFAPGVLTPTLPGDQGPGTRPSFATDQPQWDAYNAFEKLLHSERLAEIVGTPAVHNVIDTLSRPGYAVNALWEEGFRQDEAHKGERFYNPDWDKLADAAHEGWIGQNETTGFDVTNKRLWQDTAPNEDTPSDWMRSLLGFGVSVATDPLTFIPGGAVVKGMKAAGAKAGIKSTKLLRGNEALPAELADEAPIAPDLTEAATQAPTPPPPEPMTGGYAQRFPPTSVVPKTPSEITPQELGPVSMPATLMPEQGMIPWVQVPEPTPSQFARVRPALQGVEEPLIPGPGPGQESLELLSPSGKLSSNPALNEVLLNADRAVQQRALEVTGRAYNPESITRPFKDIPDTFEDIPGRPPIDQARHNAARRIFEQEAYNGRGWFNVENYDGYFRYIDTGHLLSPENVEAIVQQIARPNTVGKFKIRIIGANGLQATMSAGQYIRALANGGAGKDFSRIKIMKGTTAVPFNSYAAAKKIKYEYNQMTGTQKLTEGAKNVKFTPEEKRIWQEEMKQLLSPEDYKYLVAGAHQVQNFETRLAKILAKTKQTTYESLDALERAYKAGEVPEEAFKHVLEQYGAKTIAGAKKNADNLAKRFAANAKMLDKAKPKTAEEIGTPAASPASAPPPSPTTNPLAAAAVTKSVNANLAEAGVKPAAEIISDVAKNGRSALLESINESFKVMTPTQRKGVLLALKGYAARDITRVLETFKSITKQGARANRDLHEAQFDSFNKFNALTVTKELIRQAALILQPKYQIPKGMDRAAKTALMAARKAEMYDTLMPMIKSSEDILRARGLEPILGHGKTGIPLSLHDTLSSLPRNVVENYFMTNEKAIPVTVWLDAAELLVGYVRKGITPESTVATKEALNEILNKTIGRVPTHSMLLAHEERLAQSGGKLSQIIAITERQRLLNHLMNAAPELAQKVEVNEVRKGLKYGEQVKKLHIDALKNFADNIDQAGNVPTKLLSAVDNMEEATVKAVKENGEIPMSGAAAMAHADLVRKVANDLPLPEMRAASIAAKEVAKGNVVHAMQQNLDSAMEAAREALKDVPTVEVGGDMDWVWGARALRAIFPHMSNEHLRMILLSTSIVSKSLSNRYHKFLGKINNTYTKQEIDEAFAHLQAGTADTIANPRTKQAAVEMEQQLDLAFNTDPAVGLFLREGVDPMRINDKLAHFGVKDTFRFKGENAAEQMDSWRNWTDVKDPLDLMTRVHAAGMSIMAENQMGAEINMLFGHAEHGKDMVRMVDTKGSHLGKVINLDLYFHKDIAKELRVLNETMVDLYKPASQNKYLNGFDATTKVLKTALTIYRPGHHIRNSLGDIYMSLQDGMYDPKWYTRGLAMMSARGTEYGDWAPGILAKLSAEFGGGKTVATYRWKNTTTGKIETVKLNRKQAYDNAFAQGMFPNFDTLEDLGVGANAYDLTRAGISGKLRYVNPMFYAGIFGGKKIPGGFVEAGGYRKLMGGLSEARDHVHRGSHFLYALEKNPIVEAKTFEEAHTASMLAAGNRARKWHPDGSDRSRFENEIASRAFLFYSWQRKAMPKIIETHFATPGRALLYPKAMYGVAQANGIDLNSGYGDPFPADQAFPDWLEESQQGPQFKTSAGMLFGARMGMPGPDIMDQYFNARRPQNSLANTIGSLNPALKIPIEIAGHPQGAFAQDTRSGGSPIYNPVEYFAKQVPNSALIENLIDRSVRPEVQANASYEPQFDISNMGTLDSSGLGIANWLTGLGITDMSKPSYLRSARKEDVKNRTKSLMQSKGPR